MNIPKLLHKIQSDTNYFCEYFAKVEQIFHSKEKDIEAFVHQNNRFNKALQDYRSLDSEFQICGDRRDLSGLLIGVKDIFHVDGLPTSGGSRLPTNLLTGTEAECVQLLKKAGAIVLGKTVTTEFAYFAPGPTKNPHNLAHTPGGSSSGSAAAVAAGMVPFAFGTQTIGSIVRPASFCGVVGFKPTYGRISCKGVIPVAPSVDTIGYFTSDISSTLHMARFLCKNWNPDRICPRKPILGIPIGPYLEKSGPEILVHFNKTVSKLRDAGFKIHNVNSFTNFDEIYENHNKIVAKEAALTHKDWYKEFENLYHPKTAELIERGQNITRDEYVIALASQKIVQDELNVLQEQNKIDLWISPPALGPAPFGLDNTGDPIMNLPWTHCGFPTVNIPAGWNGDKLPMGLQVSAPNYEDEKLLNWAIDVESIIAPL